VQAWLIVTAANLCKDLLRRSHRKELSLDAAENVAAGNEEKSGMMAAIRALPAKYKTVIYLHYYEGYSVSELAKLLHRPESTIKTWLRRGRESLRESLGEEGGDVR
jgi:RNA polymerase sigma-70 factor (ECF subfamily)